MHSDSVPLLRKRQNRRNSDEKRTDMEAREEHQIHRKYQIVHACSIIIGIILFILLIVWLAYFREGFGWHSEPAKEFNWHPVSMVLAFLCICSQSILIFRTKRYLMKKKLKVIHAVLNLLAFVLAIFGLIAAFDSHNLRSPPIPNLYSLHSWVGIITVVCYGLQFVIGFSTFLYPSFPDRIRAAILPIHIALGKALFLFATISIMTGIVEKAIFALSTEYQNRPAEAWVMNCLGILVLFFGGFVLYLVNAPEYKRTPIPEDEIQLQESSK